MSLKKLDFNKKIIIFFNLFTSSNNRVSNKTCTR